jgi:hypothetical protein
MGSSQEKLVAAYYLAARFIEHQVKTQGWVWSANCIREIARCQSKVVFGNEL